MESKLFEMAASQGIWALLFVGLFIYTLKDAKTREEKYQDLVAKLSSIIDDKIKVLAEKIDNLFDKKE